MPACVGAPSKKPARALACSAAGLKFAADAALDSVAPGPNTKLPKLLNSGFANPLDCSDRTPIPNFSEGYRGQAPDIGAHQRGAPPMRFGVSAGR